MRPSKLLRLMHINIVLVRHGLDEVIFATHLFRPVRFLVYLSPFFWLRRDRAPRAVRLRRVLEDLGPIFVKFGQLLSTRRDLLPDDIAEELARLQDRVPPFASEAACAIVAKAYGRPLTEMFLEFDAKPLASASIAQVHAARLPDGRAVVVKVLRPNIEKTIRRDLSLLDAIAKLAERYWREGRRLKPRAVVAELEKTIFDELDLLREAANASQLRRNFPPPADLYVPEVHWSYARRNVIVMERITGTPISDVAALRSQGTDFKRLAEIGVQIFFTQVFRDSFFHADMHPGNIFVDASDPAEPRYMAVDFGIMGTLSPTDQHYLAQNFLAFFRRDYRRVAELHIESGWVPAETRVDEFESAMRTVCEPIFERPLKDISFGVFLLRLFQTARRFRMEVQPQLVLLQKTLLHVEGLGRMLYPDLDLWKTAKPFLERFMDEQVGARAALRAWRSNIAQWGQTVPQLPQLAFETLQLARSGRLRVEWHSSELVQLRQELRSAERRGFFALVGSILVLGGVLAALMQPGRSGLLTAAWPAWALFVTGLLFWLVAWSNRRR